MLRRPFVGRAPPPSRVAHLSLLALAAARLGSFCLPLLYGPAAFGLIFCAPLHFYYLTLLWACNSDSASPVPLLRFFGWYNSPLPYIAHLLPWLVAASFSRSAMAKQVSLPQVGSLYDAWMELSDSILDFDKDGAVDDTASAGDDFHLVCECAAAGKEWFTVVKETCRARLGRGDLTPATIHPVFSADSFNTLWTNWIDREFRDDAGFRDLLIQARMSRLLSPHS
ncbi:hypothetical protein COLO4_08818 [Corchorus olitorius]|uniref:Uncharacterized protein n=1 Tax=Corchorus olitorius TaxID=93759 RepID=A0A1R3KEK7_9ROSI|nr:hypothetical protein COLO4_08818 [Corchorus olitorius]